MKKALSLILAFALCLSLCACGNQIHNTSDTKNTQETTTPTEPPLIMNAADGYKVINYFRFDECIKEVIELSADNWHKYINIVSYIEEIEMLDAFGEIVEVKSFDRKAVGVIDGNYYYRYEDVVIELQHKDSGEKTVFEIRNGYVFDGYLDDFKIEDYTCTRIKGKIYIVDIPAEATLSPMPKWDYKCGFIMSCYGSEAPYEINPYTKVIYHNGSEIWEEEYMK